MRVCDILLSVSFQAWCAPVAVGALRRKRSLGCSSAATVQVAASRTRDLAGHGRIIEAPSCSLPAELSLKR